MPRAVLGSEVCNGDMHVHVCTHAYICTHTEEGGREMNPCACARSFQTCFFVLCQASVSSDQYSYGNGGPQVTGRPLLE